MTEQYSQPQTNSKAVTSLVLGILAVAIPYAGLVIGIIGLFIVRMANQEIAHTGEGGRNLVLAGKICAIVGVALYGAIILFFVFFMLLGMLLSFL
ncbi:hypothetical protein JCM19037_2040 [Geomicrobium sp. JCM 19037]|uniref:hypothetical protein n=1 Tax=unclassified Geomicrobium TaxID=2628951 RepID=UPI00045F2E80|nr:MULTISPECIES: hypothetical protein [unclassified Geomicrobium]GAK03700.1 hypothetical protein JCM19037_2040 [Geomicrobium sp. JCM 19037]GAK12678.1 hypothetical protein JCM19039_2471 [Geomicrobium sp. JCM 19039]